MIARHSIAALASLVMATVLAVAGGSFLGPHGNSGHALRAKPARRGALKKPRRVAGALDAGGVFVPTGDYRRIVSMSSVADGLLLALSEPERVITATEYSRTKSPFRYRFANPSQSETPKSIEGIVALNPDLVLIHEIGASSRVAQLRAAGLRVFDFGSMRGLATLLPNIRSLAALLGRPHRGEQLARQFARRMDRVSAGIPNKRHPRALYLSIYSGKIFGGTRGSSYHDVLQAAGLRDAAAEKYSGWPQYTSEQLLALNPEYLVTARGMPGQICQHPGLDRLSACTNSGKIIALPSSLLSSPGLEMLEAAEGIFEQIHGHAQPIPPDPK